MIQKFRKGQITDMQIAIIAIVAAVILTIFLHSVYVSWTEKLNVQSCKNSIEAHSLISTGSGHELFTDIKCPTEDITIKSKEEKNIKSIIAEDMHRCWYVWGQGKGQYFKGDGNFCAICSTYKFDDENQKVDGLINYLATTSIKVKYPGDKAGITYTQYLKGTQTENAQALTGRDIEELAKYDSFDTSQQYATIFVYASGKDATQKALEGGGRTTLGIVGLGGVMTGGAGVSVGVMAVFIGSNPVGWVIGGSAAIYLGVKMIEESFDVQQPETIQYVAFRPYNTEELNNLDCQKLEVNQMSNSAQTNAKQ